VEAKSTGGQGSRRTVAPSDDDDDKISLGGWGSSVEERTFTLCYVCNRLR
jgi:hypothetical protein